MDGIDRVQAAFGVNYDRLVAIKAMYDPTNVLRSTQNIEPRPAAAVAWFQLAGIGDDLTVATFTFAEEEEPG